MKVFSVNRTRTEKFLLQITAILSNYEERVRKCFHNKALTLNDSVKHFCAVRKKTETMVENLHGLGLQQDDEMLKHVIGKKLYGTEYHRISGSIAKYFACNIPAYAYPLFKTHKLRSVNALQRASAVDSPIRLL